MNDAIKETYIEDLNATEKGIPWTKNTCLINFYYPWQHGLNKIVIVYDKFDIESQFIAAALFYAYREAISAEVSIKVDVVPTDAIVRYDPMNYYVLCKVTIANKPYKDLYLKNSIANVRGINDMHSVGLLKDVYLESSVENNIPEIDKINEIDIGLYATFITSQFDQHEFPASNVYQVSTLLNNFFKKEVKHFDIFDVVALYTLHEKVVESLMNKVPVFLNYEEVSNAVLSQSGCGNPLKDNPIVIHALKSLSRLRNNFQNAYSLHSLGHEKIESNRFEQRRVTSVHTNLVDHFYPWIARYAYTLGHYYVNMISSPNGVMISTNLKEKRFIKIDSDYIQTCQLFLR